MQAQGSNSLIYSALRPRHIRVLDLSPGEEADEIEVCLLEICVDHQEPYEALSYVWGSAANGLVTIKCQGLDFSITPNLHAALKHLRKGTIKRRLWIDAICIDQSSNQERQQQVNLMRHIYGNAKMVLAWIGEEPKEFDLELLFRIANNRYDYGMQKLRLQDQPHPAGNSVVVIFNENFEAMHLIDEAQKQFEIPLTSETSDIITNMKELHGSRLVYVGRKQQENAQEGVITLTMIIPDLDVDHIKKLSAEHYTTFEDYLFEATKPPEWVLSEREMMEVRRAFNELTMRPYFRRVWIIQELLVSLKTVLVCGSHTISFETFWAVFGECRLRDAQGTKMDIKNFRLDDLMLYDAVKNWDILGQLNVSRASQLDQYDYEPVTIQIDTINYHRLRSTNQGLTQITLAELMEYYGEVSKATDPRDHVFGLVGIVQQFSTRQRELHYCQRVVNYDADVRSVFLSAASHIVDTFVHRGPDDLNDTGRHILDFFSIDSAPNIFNLPTWVPNWASETRESAVFNTRRIREISDLLPYSGSTQEDTLFISGHLIDKIDFVTEPLKSNTISRKHLYAEVELLTMLMNEKMISIYGSKEKLSEAFWRTLIVDNPVGAKSPEDHSYVFKEEKEVLEWVIHCQSNYGKLEQIWGRRLSSRRVLGPILERYKAQEETLDQQARIPEFQETIRLSLSSEEHEHLMHLADSNLENYKSLIHDIFNQESDPEWDVKVRVVRSELSKHSMICTEKGFLGIAPPSVQNGDIVALVSGSDKVWVLRPWQTHYLVQGAAWVHGVMYRSDDYHKNGYSSEEIVRFKIR